MKTLGLSFSLINSYIKCPKMALLSFNHSVVKRRNINESSLELGKMVHRLIRCKWFGMEYLRRDTAIWHTSERLADKAIDIIGFDVASAEVEKRLSVDFGDYVLVGDLDLIAYENDKITIYDWKTNKSKFGQDVLQYRLQALIYMYLLNRNVCDDRKIIFEFHNLRHDDDVLKFEFSEAVNNEVEQLLEKVAAFLKNGSVELDENDGIKDCCGTCKFNDFCRVL